MTRPCPTCGVALGSDFAPGWHGQCWRCQRDRPLPRVCCTCRTDISDRPSQARYCAPCAEVRNQERDRQQRRERYAAEQRRKRGKAPLDDVYAATAEAHCAPRDLALEARIDRYAAQIRASRRYTITDEVIWARRVDPLSARGEGAA